MTLRLEPQGISFSAHGRERLAQRSDLSLSAAVSEIEYGCREGALEWRGRNFYYVFGKSLTYVVARRPDASLVVLTVLFPLALLAA